MKLISDFNDGQKTTTANNIFAPGGVDVQFKVLLSLLHFVCGTGRSFKFPPDRKYLRWRQALTE
jgi:hypothetical protein